MTSQPHFARYFTVSEADRWIPRLRVLFARIHEALSEVADDVVTLQSTLEHRGNGGGVDTRRYFSHDRVLEDAIEQIQSAGIVIQDVQRGLVDFPHMLDGQEVLLCWELVDPDRVEWFHELQSGYAGRRPLRR